MRLRCPNKNCPIDVPDDLVGVRIRCPHCGESLVVDAKYRETPADQIQAGAPPRTGSSLPINLENQIYDGLPPLSLMIALRRQRGKSYDADELGPKFEMTDDDWKALSAFESVLFAVVSLRTTLVVVAVAVFINVLVWGASAASAHHGPELPLSRFLGRFGMLILLGACFLCMYIGSRALQRVEVRPLTSLLPWLAFLVALAVVGCAVLNALSALDGGSEASLGFIVLASIPFNLIAAFDSGRSAWRVGQSLDQVSPPEISNRLTEALKYLD